jgi:hypothetical protein
MKNKKLLLTLICLFSFLVLIINACNEYDEPPLINNPGIITNAPSPVINAILPTDSITAGIREITIVGQNFSTNLDSDYVFIGGELATIKSATSNEIVVYRPNLETDTYGRVNISIVVPTALNAALWESAFIDTPVAQYYDFSSIDRNLFAADFDGQGNLWVASRRSIYHTTPDSGVLPFVINLSPSSTFGEFTDIKFGIGGYLYLLVGESEIYRIHPDIGGNPEVYVNLPNNTERMDFDQLGNLYTGRRNGIFVVHPDKSIFNTGRYNNTNLVEVRVFNNSLYVASSKVLWRSPILDANGTLGDSSVVIDLNTVPDLSTCDITSFNIDIEGKVYLSVTKHPQYSLFIVENGASVSPFYYEDILPDSITQIIWNNEDELYLNRGTSYRFSARVYRMGVGKNGAPYFGRGL